MKSCIIDLENKITLCRSGFFIKKTWITHFDTLETLIINVAYLSKCGFVLSFKNLDEYKIK